MRMETDVVVSKYKDNVFSAAFHILKSAEDAEDVVQETFLCYHTQNKQFESEVHIRAWLLRIAINKAKNILRSGRYSTSVPLEEYMHTLPFETEESQELFEEVMRLPEKYRIVVHLFYYEDFSVREIAKILRITESSVKTRLSRARNILRNILTEEGNDNDG